MCSSRNQIVEIGQRLVKQMFAACWNALIPTQSGDKALAVDPSLPGRDKAAAETYCDSSMARLAGHATLSFTASYLHD